MTILSISATVAPDYSDEVLCFQKLGKVLHTQWVQDIVCDI